MVFELDFNLKVDNFSVVRTVACYILFAWEFKFMYPYEYVEAKKIKNSKDVRGMSKVAYDF
jgi:hypothetical protein